MSAEIKLAPGTENTATTWVVFTGKLPAQTKKRLKVMAALTGVKQQVIVAEAVEFWMKLKGFEAKI